MSEALRSEPRIGIPMSMPFVRAAEYVRMSTEHQKYSTENQAEAIREYAARRGFVIVQTYADEGKSGLRLDGRDALKRLIEDVEYGAADFTTILVYDVSRWGRFQDADESAYYEYICKRAGIGVQYCAEQFENDGSPVSTIVKGVKRAMAGEYSRELSAKVFSGQCHLIELGFRQGGPPGYGLRRQLVDKTGLAKGILARGEQKSIQTDRIVLVPGPPEEIETVRWVYESFVQSGLCEREIADVLNSRKVATDLGRPWTRGTVHQILINEKYIGSNVWNRISYKLKRKRVRNAPETWIRADGAFEPIVDRSLFAAAQAIIRSRSCRLANEEMLEGLKQLLEERGYGYVSDWGRPHIPKWEERFQGRLSIRLEEVRIRTENEYWGPVIRRVFADSKKRDVAKSIPTILSTIAAIAVAKRENRAADERRRMAREEAERRRVEAERRAEIERKRRAMLDKLMFEHEQIVRFEGYLAALEGSLKGDERPERVARLIMWTRERLEKLRQASVPGSLEARLAHEGAFETD